MAVAVQIAASRWQDGVLWYDLAVDSLGKRWTMRKRYTDFVQLDRQLASAAKDVTRQALPPKGLVGMRHRLDLFGFNKKRRAELSRWMGHLAAQLGPVADCPELAAFLGVVPCCISEEAAGSATSGGEKVPMEEDDPPLTPPAGARSGSRPLPAPIVELRDFAPHWRYTDCSGPEWRALRAAEPALEATIQLCAELVVCRARFQNECEGAFARLRRQLPASGARTALGELPGKAVVWDFLVLVAARRPIYRRQAAQAARLLQGCPAWADALRAHGDLHQLAQQLLECP